MAVERMPEAIASRSSERRRDAAGRTRLRRVAASAATASGKRASQGQSPSGGGRERSALAGEAGKGPEGAAPVRAHLLGRPVRRSVVCGRPWDCRSSEWAQRLRLVRPFRTYKCLRRNVERKNKKVGSKTVTISRDRKKKKNFELNKSMLLTICKKLNKQILSNKSILLVICSVITTRRVGVAHYDLRGGPGIPTNIQWQSISMLTT